MKTIATFICALMAAVSVGAAAELSQEEQALREAQQQAANTYVVKEGTKIAVAVDGLCCATCGIGVKKKLQKLDFVARKGVAIDVDHSMAIVTLKEANVVDQGAIVEAIRSAGYKPISVYQWDGCCAKAIDVSRAAAHEG